MSLTWTPAEASTPVWTPATDEDLTLTSRGTLSSDAVTYDGDTLTEYLDTLGTGGGAGVLDLVAVVGTAAVDGTATEIALLVWDQNAAASGLAPAKYTTLMSGSPSDVSGFLTGVLGYGTDDTVTVLVPAGTHVGAWSFTPATITDPWTSVDGNYGVQSGESLSVFAFFDDPLGVPRWVKVNDADTVTYVGTGLLYGVTNVHDALHTTEGILDRPLYVSGMCVTTNIDITATNPALEFGECVATAYIWLNGQTDPDENRCYAVASDLTLTRLEHPDVFEPPGNGAERRLLAPAEPEHGLTYTWFNDDRTKVGRAGSIPAYEAPDSDWSGEWIKTFDPTASGGGGAVDSVNGETGTVVLDAADVGAVPASALARIPTTVRVASDVNSTTDASFTNTTGLSFPVTNGTTTYFHGMLDVTGINAADLKVTATCPAGTIRVAVGAKNYASTATAADGAYAGEITSSGEAVTNLAVITGRSTCVPFSGYFAATADGTVQIQHAQRTANATVTVAKAGSFLTYHT